MKQTYLNFFALARRCAPGLRFGEGIRENPDFVAMDSESLRDLETNKTWLEW